MLSRRAFFATLLGAMPVARVLAAILPNREAQGVAARGTGDTT